MANEKKVSMFTYLNQIHTKNRTHPYDKKIASAWMICQWLAHDKQLIGKVNNINKYLSLLPDEVIYEYFMNALPAGKRYIKWTKKRKSDDLEKRRINKLKSFYPNMSTKEAKMAIGFLGKKK